MSIVRVHACMCRVRMYACTLCRRMLACDCVHVRSVDARAHACLRAHARMHRVHVHARSRAGARARKCKCPHEGMRLYMCVGVRGYVHV